MAKIPLEHWKTLADYLNAVDNPFLPDTKEVLIRGEQDYKQETRSFFQWELKEADGRLNLIFRGLPQGAGTGDDSVLTDAHSYNPMNYHRSLEGFQKLAQDNKDILGKVIKTDFKENKELEEQFSSIKKEIKSIEEPGVSATLHVISLPDNPKIVDVLTMALEWQKTHPNYLKEQKQWQEIHQIIGNLFPQIVTSIRKPSPVAVKLKDLENDFLHAPNIQRAEETLGKMLDAMVDAGYDNKKLQNLIIDLKKQAEGPSLVARKT